MVGWSTPRPGRSRTGKGTWYPLYRRLGGPQSRSKRLRKSTTIGTFFWISYLFLCTFSVLASPSWLSWLMLLLYNPLHQHPCLRRDSNPQSQQASGLTPFGHWDQQRFDPRPVQSIASRYTDYTISAHVCHVGLQSMLSVSYYQEITAATWNLKYCSRYHMMKCVLSNEELFLQHMTGLRDVWVWWPRATSPATQWTGVWVSLRTFSNVMARKNISVRIRTP